MTVTGDVIGLISICVAMLGTLVGFVWNSAVTTTSLKLRVSALEREHEKTVFELSKEMEKLQLVIENLRATVWELTTTVKVQKARESSGQFDLSDSEPPKRR